MHDRSPLGPAGNLRSARLARGRPESPKGGVLGAKGGGPRINRVGPADSGAGQGGPGRRRARRRPAERGSPGVPVTHMSPRFASTVPSRPKGFEQGRAGTGGHGHI
ncbi:hypothetical protein IBTHAUMO2_780016 [Nitrosopumilaceae archaeon]|nr:hypothetical protein IBTHAUMO2_780016 [Nitrosopumilaceae archaeon]